MKSPILLVESADEDEAAQTSKVPPSRARPRPNTKSKSVIGKNRIADVEEGSDIQELESLPKSPRKRKAAGPDTGNHKRRKQPRKVAESGTEAETTTKGKKGKKQNERDSETELESTTKDVERVDDEVIGGKPKKRPRVKAGSANRLEEIGPPTQKKPAGRASSKQPSQGSASPREAGDREDEESKPAKKRKIRIFNPTQPSIFSLNLNGTSVSPIYQDYSPFFIRISPGHWRNRYPH
jgi:hypothetical protein